MQEYNVTCCVRSHETLRCSVFLCNTNEDIKKHLRVEGELLEISKIRVTDNFSIFHNLNARNKRGIGVTGRVRDKDGDWRFFTGDIVIIKEENDTLVDITQEEIDFVVSKLIVGDVR